MRLINKTEYLKNILAPQYYRLQSIAGIRPRQICLITGCPRSGTSAVLYWLKAQKQLTGFYESRIMISAHRFLNEVENFKELQTNRRTLIKMIRKLVFSYYAQNKYVWRKILVEKEPLEPVAFPEGGYDNFLQHIRFIFPEIKFLFMVRDPIPTIWSIINRKWGNSLTRGALREYSLEESVQIWNSCAKLVAKYHSDKNTYVCSFKKLTSDPICESNNIFKFLSIFGGKSFIPRTTKLSRFCTKDEQYILKATQRWWEMLLEI